MSMDFLRPGTTYCKMLPLMSRLLLRTWFRSMDHDRDGRLLRLRTELREVHRENARLRRENGEYSRFLFQSRTEEDI